MHTYISFWKIQNGVPRPTNFFNSKGVVLHIIWKLHDGVQKIEIGQSIMWVSIALFVVCWQKFNLEKKLSWGVSAQRKWEILYIIKIAFLYTYDFDLGHTLWVWLQYTKILLKYKKGICFVFIVLELLKTFYQHNYFKISFVLRMWQFLKMYIAIIYLFVSLNSHHITILICIKWRQECKIVCSFNWKEVTTKIMAITFKF